MDIEKLEALNEIAVKPVYRMARWLAILLVVSVLGNIVQALKNSEVNLIADDNMYSEISQTQG